MEGVPFLLRDVDSESICEQTEEGGGVCKRGVPKRPHQPAKTHFTSKKIFFKMQVFLWLLLIIRIIFIKKQRFRNTYR